jgi:CheY-like chemotaxis protein
VCAQRFLIVDDDRDSSEALATLLARSGAHVALANSAGEAFRLFRVRSFDVMVSDISMPGEDGLSLIRRIRSSEAREGRSRLLAIALTTSDRGAAIAAGFDAYLEKPLDLRALLSLLPPSAQLVQPPAEQPP